MGKAYDSDVLCDLIVSAGMKACIPPRSNRVNPAAYNKELYQRHFEKNFFEKLKGCAESPRATTKSMSPSWSLCCLASCTLSLRNQFKKTRPNHGIIRKMHRSNEELAHLPTAHTQCSIEALSTEDEPLHNATRPSDCWSKPYMRCSDFQS